MKGIGMGKDNRTKIGSGEVSRFDQRLTMFSRPRDAERSDSEMLEMGRKYYGVRTFKNDDGYTLKDWALAMGGWYLERWWGFGNIVGNRGLYEWHPDQMKIAERDRLPPGNQWQVSDPAEMSAGCAKSAGNVPKPAQGRLSVLMNPRRKVLPSPTITGFQFGHPDLIRRA